MSAARGQKRTLLGPPYLLHLRSLPSLYTWRCRGPAIQAAAWRASLGPSRWGREENPYRTVRAVPVCASLCICFSRGPRSKQLHHLQASPHRGRPKPPGQPQGQTPWDDPHAEVGIKPQLSSRGRVIEEKDQNPSPQLYKLKIKSIPLAGWPLCLWNI